MTRHSAPTEDPRHRVCCTHRVCVRKEYERHAICVLLFLTDESLSDSDSSCIEDKKYYKVVHFITAIKVVDLSGTLFRKTCRCKFLIDAYLWGASYLSSECLQHWRQNTQRETCSQNEYSKRFCWSGLYIQQMFHMYRKEAREDRA